MQAYQTLVGSSFTSNRCVSCLQFVTNFSAIEQITLQMSKHSYDRQSSSKATFGKLDIQLSSW